MIVKVANAFSLNMLKVTDEVKVRIKKISLSEAKNLIEKALTVQNAIRHPATMQLIQSQISFPSNTITVPAITLEKGDKLIVFIPVWKGGRPPQTKDYTIEELKTLTEGLNIFLVELI